MKKYVELLKQTFTEFGQDKAPRLGAALAYYTIFSIAPLLLIAIAIAGFAFGEEAARNQISGQLGGLMGEKTAGMVNEMVESAAKPKSGTIATIVGIVMLLFGASGVFGQLQDALNTIWNVEPKQGAGVMGFIKDRFLSMAMVCGIGFLLLVTLIVDAALSAMGDWIAGWLPGGETLLHIVQLTFSFALITFLFAAIFRYLPDTEKRVAWRDVWLGAAVTSFLFVIGKFALGMYIGRTAADSTYGAAGSLVVVLLWVYWSAQILFLGAEFTQVYARSFGSMKGDTSKAQARASAQRVEDRPKDLEPTPIRRPAPAAAKTKKSRGGAGKLAAGGVIGLILGTIVGGITALVVALKSVKKLFSFR